MSERILFLVSFLENYTNFQTKPTPLLLVKVTCLYQVLTAICNHAGKGVSDYASGGAGGEEECQLTPNCNIQEALLSSSHLPSTAKQIPDTRRWGEEVKVNSLTPGAQVRGIILCPSIPGSLRQNRAWWWLSLQLKVGTLRQLKSSAGTVSPTQVKRKTVVWDIAEVTTARTWGGELSFQCL